MNKDLHKQEEELYNIVQQHRDTPPDFVWSQVQSELESQKRNRRAWIIWTMFFSVFVIVVLIGSVCYMQSKKDEVESSMLDQKLEESIIDDQLEKSSQAILGQKNLKNLKQATPLSSTLETESEQYNGLVERNELVITDGNQRIKSTTQNEHATQSAKNTSEEELISEETEGDFIESQSLNYTVKTREQIMPTVANAANSTNFQQNINIDELLSNNRPSESQSSLSSSNIKSAFTTPLIDPLELRVLDLAVPFALDLNQPSDVGEPSEQDDRFLDFYEFGMSVGKQIARIETAIPSAAVYRMNTESHWHTWSANFAFGYSLNTNFYTKLGIDISQLVDRFDYKVEGYYNSAVFEETNHSYHLAKVLYHNFGDIRYTLISVEFLGGYKKVIKRYSVGAEAGLIYNARLNVEGKIQFDETDIQNFDTTEFFEPNADIGLRLGLASSFMIAPDLAITLSPNYVHYFREVSTEANSLDQRISYLNMRLGLRFYL